MKHLFDIDRTVRCYRLYFSEHGDELAALLRSVARCLGRALPPEVSRRIDEQGSSLAREGGRLTVRRHPDLERARRELAELGLFRVFLPEDVGGFGLPLCVYYLAVQLVSYFDSSLALTFLVHGNAMYAIQRFGTPQQRLAELPSLASGERLATVAFTEPRAGSDAGLIRTRAERDGDGYVLTGDKLFITHGGDADLLITTARTGPLSQGIAGVSAFLVQREADGVELLGLEHKTGQAGSPTAALSYPGVRIPAHRLLGQEGRGGAVMFAGVGMTRVNIGAQALGIAKRAFDLALDFARQREQGGRTIIGHDAIQQRLAGMALTISAVENLICYDSWLEHQGQWHVLEMSIAKYFASEALQELTQRAINVFGGYGVCRDQGVERCRREAVSLPLYGGTSEIQWYIISRELLDTLAGDAHADYRARHRQRSDALRQRCGGELAPLAHRAGATLERLWQAAQEVARRPDPAPMQRHLTELVTAQAVAEGLLWQASGPQASELDLQLAAWATERLEEQAGLSCGRIFAGQDRAGLKRALLEELKE